MNYYEILKIQKNASQQQIKSSYKELVKKYHPDLYVGDKEFAEHKIKEINEAYDILSNLEKKREYDEYLNLSSNPTTTYKNTTYPQTEIKNDTTDPENQWSFTKFITNKFNQLDKKKQLQIFIFIVILILTLFLINLIEVKYYLSHPEKNNLLNTTHHSNTSNSNTIELTEEPYRENLYDSEKYKTFDNFLYDLFQSYENDYFSNPSNHEFENIF